MKLDRFIEILEELSPITLAEPWDNPGLLIEPEAREITRVLVALDCTPAVAEEAKEVGAQLVLSHHPLFFAPVKHITRRDPATAAAWALLRAGIGLYAAHTNLDSAIGGVNDVLANILGLTDTAPLTQGAQEGAGLGRVGNLPAPMPLADFARMAGEALHTVPRFGGPEGHICRRVAVIGGSGGDCLKEAIAAGADTLFTGEAKHNHALDAIAMNMAIVVAGHYETERPVLTPWIGGLQKRLCGLQCNVDFVISEKGASPLGAL